MVRRADQCGLRADLTRLAVENCGDLIHHFSRRILHSLLLSHMVRHVNLSRHALSP
jgi:hypothetical protein